MLKPESMQRIGIVVRDDKLEPLLGELNEAGVMQIKEASKDILDMTDKMPRVDYEAKLSSQYMRTKRILEFFQLVKVSREKKASILSKLQNLGKVEPIKKVEVKYEKPEEMASRIEGELCRIESEVNVFKDSLDKIEERKTVLKEQLNALNKLEPLSVDLEHLTHTYKHSMIKVGIIESEYLDELKNIDSITTGFSFYHTEKINEKSVLLLICVHRDYEDVVNGLLNKIKFEQIKVPPLSGMPEENIEMTRKRLLEVDKEENKILDQVYTRVLEEEESLLIQNELLSIELKKLSNYTMFYKTTKSVVIEAWTPLKNFEYVKKISESATGGEVIIEKIDSCHSNPGEEPPTLLNNPAPVNSFETLTEMYGTPRYNEVDPTLFISIFYTLIFGFMLADVIYGAGIIAIALLVGRTVPKVKPLANIFLLCGISATFFGILTGSYLGDFMLRLVGIDIGAIWVNPFGTEQPSFMGYPISPVMLILVVSILLGAIHMDIGIVIALKDAIHDKNIRSILGGVGTLILEFGLIIVLFKFFGVKAISEGLFGIGIKLIVIGSAFILIYCGPLGFFDVTGFLGDMISYSRILALNMATGGLALAVNVTAMIIVSFMGLVKPDETGAIPLIIGRIIENPVMILPAIIFATVLIVGHTASLAINTLGGAIHTLRLHYAEFFGRFYEGGGIKYHPLCATREKTVLKLKGE